MVAEMAEARCKVAGVLAHMRNRSLGAALRGWAAATARRRYCRAVMAAAVARLLSGQLGAAFGGWRDGARRRARLQVAAHQVGRRSLSQH